MRYCLVFVWLCLTSVALAQSQFELDVMSKTDEYREDFDHASDLMLAGDTQGATKAFLALTEKDPSPAAALLVGNLLFNLDREASYTLHRRAYEAEPAERSVVLRWAIQRHRKGDVAEAMPLYRRYVKLSPKDKRVNALLADCLIRQGKAAEAVTAWDAADQQRNRLTIDALIYEIYGDISPHRKRAELLRAVEQGDAAAAEKLIDQDLNMERDWWNSRVSKAGLKHDLPLVGKLLGTGSKRFGAIECWAQIKSEEEPPREFVKAELEKAGLIVGTGAVPESSLIAWRLLNEAAEYKLEPRARLWERFSKELMEAAKSKEGDVAALDALCVLAVNQRDRQIELNKLGWERYHEARFAGNLLASLVLANKLTAESPELARALKEFPESSAVQLVAVQMAGKEKLTAEVLSAAIGAEFRRPSPGKGGTPDSDTLAEYFALLKGKLRGGASEESPAMRVGPNSAARATGLSGSRVARLPISVPARPWQLPGDLDLA